MTKQKLFKHVLPIMLSAMLLFSALPMSASANDESTDKVASKIVREVVELREESVKHFLCEDGSYIAVSYAEPVHYEKNGEWLEIDNTLVLSSENTYVPKSSDVAVSIPQSFSGGEQITATNKGHTISFGVASGNENVALSKTAAVKAVEALPSSIAADVSIETLSNAELSATATVGKVDTAAQIEAYNSEKTTVDNQAGALIYDKIFPNADLEYIVTGNSIKENVVVYQPQTEYIYTFDMDFGGLTPVAEKDGSYRLIDSTKPEETVFVLAAPYMYDANGEESYEVGMSLIQNGDNYLLTLTADETWINSSERAFPVVIDPTVYYDFDDVFVMDGLLNQNTTKINKELRVGRNLTNLTRTYIKISDEPDIDLGSHIIDARLILSVDHHFQALGEKDMVIYLYDCNNLPNWTATSVTWNNQPFGNTENSHHCYSNYRLDTAYATESTETYRFNITNAVRNWIMTGVNKGFMLASSDEEAKVQIDFHSSRADVSKPLIQVNYREANIDPDSWETDKDAAISPEINVNTTASWTATANQPWIALSTTSGMGVGAFNVSVTENPSANHREGTVTVALSTGNPLTLTVWQGGSTAYFSADKDDITFNYKGSDNPDDQAYWASVDYLTKVVDINTNYDWTVEIVYIGESTGWLSAEKKKDGNLYLTATKTNTANTVRKATVTIKSGETVLHEIGITQLDEISSYFNQLNPDDPSKVKTSSDYNHPLAAWAMALSYAAYNPIQSQFLPLIPSSFMQNPYDDETKTAEFELESMGFDTTTYNYETGAEIYVAHTIAHREIFINNNDTEGDLKNAYSRYDDVDVGSDWAHSEHLSSIETNTGNISSGNSGEITLNSGNISNTRPLVVVVVRGSVTFMDWLIDLGNQFNAEHLNFQSGMEEIIKSLYGCTELCDECNGNGCEEVSSGYLDGINDPIILITGHSLGAAIANLTADYLNQKLGVDNVYAYTFATPNTVNIASGDQAEAYQNVFNILNNNDFVPHFPVDELGTEWARHGRDFHITMPLNVDWILGVDLALLGAAGHGMPNYYAWLNNLPGTLGKPAEDITVTDLDEISVDFAVGAIAKLFKVLCPVTVTLYDTDGSIIPFESQQDNAEYPKMSDTGIVSWITEDGGKMFLFPYGTEDIEARIEAYDYGTMTLTVEQPGIGEPIDSITYNNVNLFPGRTFEVVIPEDTEEVSIGNVSLVEVDDNGDTIGEITELDSYLKSVTVDDPAVTYGTTSTFTVVTDKDAVKIQFIYHNSGTTMTLTRDHSLVTSLVEDGDNLIWTVQKVFTRGNHIFDFGVKMGSTWYITEQVIALTVN